MEDSEDCTLEEAVTKTTQKTIADLARRTLGNCAGPIAMRSVAAEAQRAGLRRLATRLRAHAKAEDRADVTWCSLSDELARIGAL